MNLWSVQKRDTDACQRDLYKPTKQQAVGHLISDKCEYLGDIRINDAPYGHPMGE